MQYRAAYPKALALGELEETLAAKAAEGDDFQLLARAEQRLSRAVDELSSYDGDCAQGGQEISAPLRATPRHP